MHQLLLVSEQPMPNFLPLLSQELKPSVVTLAVSSAMEQRAEALKREIGSLGIEIRPDLPISDPYDISAIQQAVFSWLDLHADEDVALNLTGGTKPMSIASQEAFRIADKPAFYVDIQSDRATFLDATRSPVQLDNQPTIGQFFRIADTTVESYDETMSIPNRKWATLAATLSNDMGRWSQALGLLNRCAMEAEQDDSLDFDHPNEAVWCPVWNDLIDELYGNELIASMDTRSRFCSAEARRFCKGIWLEFFTFKALHDMVPDARRRLWRNVKIRRGEGANELDAAFLHRNTLFIVECKTRNMQKDGIVDNTIYKLSDVSRKIGLRAKGILVSARQVRGADKKRAEASGILVFDNPARLAEQFRSAVFR